MSTKTTTLGRSTLSSDEKLKQPSNKYYETVLVLLDPDRESLPPHPETNKASITLKSIAKYRCF